MTFERPPPILMVALLNLLFPMLLGMRLRRVVGVLTGMEGVGPCRVGVVRRFLVVTRRVMLCRLGVMPGCVRMVVCCVLVMLGGFMRHQNLPNLFGCAN